MLKAFLDLRDLHRLFDSAEGVLEKQIGTPICVPYCGLCCQTNVPTVMIIEAINMASMLAGKARLKQICDVAEDWLLEKHPFLKIYEGVPVGLLSQELRGEWAAISGGRCPFLDSQMKCMVHAMRPLVCRAFGVTRDVVGCPRPLGRGETSTSRAVVESTKVRSLVQEFKDSCKERKPEWIIRGFIPSILFRAAYPDRFRLYADNNMIASAKLIGTEIDTSLMWQPQIDHLRRGKSPDLVSYAYATDDPEALLAGLK